MKIGLDTNVLIAAWASWHECHRQAHAAIAAAKSQGHTPIVASHAVKECYAVLTRLPQPWRFSPAQASALLIANAENLQLIEARPPANAVDFVRRAAQRHIGGGQTYDFDMLESLLAADVERIWTFNVRHFRAWAPTNVVVTEPDASELNRPLF